MHNTYWARALTHSHTHTQPSPTLPPQVRATGAIPKHGTRFSHASLGSRTQTSRRHFTHKKIAESRTVEGRRDPASQIAGQQATQKTPRGGATTHAIGGAVAIVVARATIEAAVGRDEGDHYFFWP